MSYPDKQLIDTLYGKFLKTGLESLSHGETLDLINHLREASKPKKVYMVKETIGTSWGPSSKTVLVTLDEKMADNKCRSRKKYYIDCYDLEYYK